MDLELRMEGRGGRMKKDKHGCYIPNPDPKRLCPRCEDRMTRNRYACSRCHTLDDMYDADMGHLSPVIDKRMTRNEDWDANMTKTIQTQTKY